MSAQSTRFWSLPRPEPACALFSGSRAMETAEDGLIVAATEWSVNLIVVIMLIELCYR
jgi:hypothetical protein